MMKRPMEKKINAAEQPGNIIHVWTISKWLELTPQKTKQTTTTTKNNPTSKKDKNNNKTTQGWG